MEQDEQLLNIEVLGMIKPRKPSPTGWYNMRGEPLTEEDLNNLDAISKVEDSE